MKICYGIAVALLSLFVREAGAVPSFVYQFNLLSVECPTLDPEQCAQDAIWLGNEFDSGFIAIAVNARANGYAGYLAHGGPIPLAPISVGVTDLDLNVLDSSMGGIFTRRVWVGFLEGGRRLGGPTPVSFASVFDPLLPPYDDNRGYESFASEVTDFGQFTTYSMRSDPDGLWSGFYGSDGGPFVQQTVYFTGEWVRTGVIPEPGALALLSLGLAGLAITRSLKR